MSRDKKIIRAYFDGNSRNEEGNVKIVSILTRLNCNVIQTVIGSDLSFTLNPESTKSNINVFNDKIKDISSSDIFVCEISESTTSHFFEIFEAIQKGKPTIALYKQGTVPAEAWLSDKYDFFTLRAYDDSDIEEVLKEFLKYASSKMLSSRFTLRLNKDLLDYIDTLKPTLGCKSRNDVILTILKNFKDPKTL